MLSNKSQKIIDRYYELEGSDIDERSFYVLKDVQHKKNDEDNDDEEGEVSAELLLEEMDGDEFKKKSEQQYAFDGKISRVLLQ